MEDQKQARDQLRAMWPKLERELMGINEQDRVRSEQFKPAQATERVDEDCELRPRRRAEAKRERHNKNDAEQIVEGLKRDT